MLYVREIDSEVGQIMGENYMRVEFSSKSENEKLARTIIAAFLADLDPTVEEISDVKTAVSEAVTNGIIHGYDGSCEGKLVLEAGIKQRKLTVLVEDYGIGIPDIKLAREPMYTTKPDQERSGLGFTFMESFMDSVDIISSPGIGTTIRMTKQIS